MTELSSAQPLKDAIEKVLDENNYQLRYQDWKKHTTDKLLALLTPAERELNRRELEKLCFESVEVVRAGRGYHDFVNAVWHWARSGQARQVPTREALDKLWDQHKYGPQGETINVYEKRIKDAIYAWVTGKPSAVPTWCKEDCPRPWKWQNIHGGRGDWCKNGSIVTEIEKFCNCCGAQRPSPRETA